MILLNGVTVNEYMEEATKWLRSIKLGEILADGRCLASDLLQDCLSIMNSNILWHRRISDEILQFCFKCK